MVDRQIIPYQMKNSKYCTTQTPPDKVSSHRKERETSLVVIHSTFKSYSSVHSVSNPEFICCQGQSVSPLGQLEYSSQNSNKLMLVFTKVKFEEHARKHGQSHSTVLREHFAPEPYPIAKKFSCYQLIFHVRSLSSTHPCPMHETCQIALI